MFAAASIASDSSEEPDQSRARSFQNLLSIVEPCHELNMKDSSMRRLLVMMLKESSMLMRTDINADDRDYDLSSR
jgi:hypothetical protein